MHVKRAGMALAALLALGVASPGTGHAAGPIPPGTPSNIFATGGEVVSDFVGFEAVLYSELWFFGSVYPADLQNPVGGMFVSHNGGTVGDPTPLPPMTDPKSLGVFGAGAELVFGLFVPAHDRWFWTGPVANNIDSNIHVKLTNLGGNNLEVGFEDLCRGQYDAGDVCEASNPGYIADWDYDDHRFLLTNATTAPEPVSMALLGTGLAGLGFARRRRRQNKDEA